MNERDVGGHAPAIETPVAEYEAPRVETVLTSEDVERESLYGGITPG